MSYDIRTQARLAAQQLAQVGLSRDLLEYFGVDREVIELYSRKEHPRWGQQRQSKSMAWLRGPEAVYVVRAYRIFVMLFSRNANFEKPVTIVDLWDWYEVYSLIYPEDVVTAGRLWGIFQKVLDKTLVPQSCKECGHPYLVHVEDYALQTCSICLLAKKQRRKKR